MTKAIIRKVSFFFPLQTKEREESLGGSTTMIKTNPTEKQLVRSFLVGSQSVSKIEERSDDSTNSIFFDIYKNGILWKSYTPRVSDTEIEYNI